jgi:hypothetical protein
MAQLRAEGFVCGDNLAFPPPSRKSNFIRLKGSIFCLGGIRIDVTKHWRILYWEGKVPVIQTERYAYHAMVEGFYGIFRYDNVHRTPYKGHHDRHHKHLIDWKTGKQFCSPPEWVGEEKWPVLDKVIEELRDWYWENKLLLPDPEACAVRSRNWNILATV